MPARGQSAATLTFSLNVAKTQKNHIKNALLPHLLSHELDVTTAYVNTVMWMLKGSILQPSSLSTPTGVGRISDGFLDNLGQMALCE